MKHGSKEITFKLSNYNKKWKSPSSLWQKICMPMHSKTKVMPIVFFNYEGVVQCEYAPQGHTINQHFYLQVLRCLHEAVHHWTAMKVRIWQMANSL